MLILSLQENNHSNSFSHKPSDFLGLYQKIIPKSGLTIFLYNLSFKDYLESGADPDWRKGLAQVIQLSD